jgi:DNA mismatch repair protein MSH5
LVIHLRQDAVACFLRSENLVTSDVMHNHLKGLKNMPCILGLMKGGRAKLSDSQGLVKVKSFPPFWDDAMKLKPFLSSLRSVYLTMLQDAMSELHEGNDIDILRE